MGRFFAEVIVIFREDSEKVAILDEGPRGAENPASGMFPEILWRG